MNKLKLYFLRCKLDIRKFELFKFTRTDADGIYYFSDDELIKIYKGQKHIVETKWKWLFDKNLEIEYITSNKNHNKNYNKKYNKNITKTMKITKTRKKHQKSKDFYF